MNTTQAYDLLDQLYCLSLKWKFDPAYRRPNPKTNIQYQNKQNLFQLAAELRNEIYALVAKQDTKVILQRLRLPGLCQVNRQMRHESLEYYFELNTFILEIPAPVVLRRTVERSPLFPSVIPVTFQFLQTADSRFPQTGVLNLRPGVLELLQNAGPAMCMRNFDLAPTTFEIAGRQRCEHLNAVVSLRAPQGGVSWQESCHLWGDLLSNARTHEDQTGRRYLRHLTTPATAIWQAAIAQNGFRGLSLADLEALAATIRVDLPPVGPGVLLDPLQ